MLVNRFLSAKTKKWVKDNRIERSTTSFKNSRTIGILFSVGDADKLEVIKKFIQDLETEGKEVKVLAYLPQKKENQEFLYDFFTKKDINFWGNYRSNEVTKFTEHNFDYLFNIDFETNELINGVLAQSKAKCRVGFYKANSDRYYELMVTVKEKSIEQLVEEMYKYTSMLN